MSKFLLLALLSAAAPALAADPDYGEENAPPPKMSSLVVYGNDPCPRSTAQEIVVCSRLPENERYRLPKRFRGKRPADAPAVESWSNRVQMLETVSRAGTPNSCSPVGSGGQTGCFQKFLRDAAAERRQAKADAAEVP